MNRRLVRYLRYAVLEIVEKPARKPPKLATGRGPERSPKYRAWIRTLPCAACETTRNVQAAHTGSDGGIGQKSSDYSCIPLCEECHTLGNDAYHVIGKVDFEVRWFLNLEKLVKKLNREWEGRAA